MSDELQPPTYNDHEALYRLGKILQHIAFLTPNEARIILERAITLNQARIRTSERDLGTRATHKSS